MSEMKKLGASEVKLLRHEVEKALKAVGDEYGLTFELGNIKYNDAAFHFTSVKGILKSSSNEGVIVDPKHERLAQYELRHLDAKPAHIIGSVVDVIGLGICTIKDFNPRGQKYPFVVRPNSGGQYKTSVASIKRFMEV